jgi:hypothetical protein
MGPTWKSDIVSILAALLTFVLIVALAGTNTRVEQFANDDALKGRIREEFKIVMGRYPRDFERDRILASVLSGVVQEPDLGAHIREQYRTLPASKENEFRSALYTAQADPSPKNKRRLVTVYNILFCDRIKDAPAVNFYAYLRDNFPEAVQFIRTVLAEYGQEMAKGCNLAPYNASDTCDSYTRLLCNADDMAHGPMLYGPEKFKRAVYAMRTSCGKDAKVCADNYLTDQSFSTAHGVIYTSKDLVPDQPATCLWKPLAPTTPKNTRPPTRPPKRDDEDDSTGDGKCIQYILNRPHIVYNASSPGCATQTTNSAEKAEREKAAAEKAARDKCVQEFNDRDSKLAKAQLKRDKDDLESRCAANIRQQKESRYLNATDDGKLFPEYAWSVPQQRPPVCINNSGCAVQPSTAQTALIGTLLGDASKTSVGSLRPSFTYSEP